MKLKLIIDKEKDEEVVITAHEHSALVRQIEALISNQTNANRIPGYTEDTITMLDIHQIECVTVLDGKVYAIDHKNRRHRLKQRLYELEAILPPSFIRINKSSLANEAFLSRFSVTYSGAVDAVFKCGYTEYVSRRCFAQIKRRFENK